MVKLLKNKFFWLGAGLILVFLVAIWLIAGNSSQTEIPPAKQSSTRDVNLPAGTSLPAAGQITIQLREGGVDGPLIAEQVVDNPQQSSQTLQIDHDPQQLDQNKTYYAVVKVYDAAGQLVFSGNAPYPVDNSGWPLSLSGSSQAPETPPNNQSPPEDNPPAQRQTRAPEQTPEQQTQNQTENQTSPQTQNSVNASVKIHFDKDYNLPDQSKLVVHLRDLGRIENSTNKTVDSVEIVDPGRPPVLVEFNYNPDQAPPDNRYLVSAHIENPAGQRLMTSSQFGFEMKLGQIDGLDVHLLTIRPDTPKDPEELDAAVTGTVRYQKSCRLPAGSKLVVQIIDSSLADAPSPLVAETEIVDPGQSPVSFEIKYDSSDIVKYNLYSLTGKILDPNGRLLFINDTVYEVITRNHPNRVNLPLVKVKGC